MCSVFFGKCPLLRAPSGQPPVLALGRNGHYEREDTVSDLQTAMATAAATVAPLTVTVPEACRLTGLGRTKVFELVKEARLKSVAIGRRRLILYSSIVALAGEAAR